MDQIEVWGFPITAVTLDETVEIVTSAWNDLSKRETILFQNLHTLYLQSNDAEFLRCYSSALSVIDGMPLVSLLRALGYDLTDEHRITALDIVHPLLSAAVADGKRVFVVGQEEKTLQLALARLRMKHEGLEISGHHGFFETEGPAAQHVIAAANEFGAELVFVGLGSPKGELWIDRNRDAFDASVVWASGALMEYIAGVVPTPPRWAGPMHLEWAFRLASSPSRFLARYFVEPVVLAGRVLVRRAR